MTNGAPYPYEPPAGDDRQAHRADGARRPDRPSRTRTVLALGSAAWIVLEIWLLVTVADATSGLVVLALLVAGFVLGLVAIKRAGRRAWRRLQATMQAAQPGGPPLPDTTDERAGGNAFAMLGGLLLMVPGFGSDVLGLLCLFPPTSALLRRGTERLLSRGELGQALRQARAAERSARMRRPDGKVVQGEVVRDDDPAGPARD
ncbi:FxsA family membrane protein [Streptomyces sp. Z26]|uniref:FxsA family membrane protein n=1 Tax=Streptomyces TaxID=1883 RepID=UPI000EF13D7F|nr:FxsA family membrane protein [Streptomyces sp. Z26]RLL65693.1 FxsA family protein [Streptomyces sp. Z26]